MKTLCPYCNQIFDVGNEWLGQQMACPACGSAFAVTEAPQCMNCGTVNYPGSTACAYCQTPLASGMMPMPDAGADTDLGKYKFLVACYWILYCLSFGFAVAATYMTVGAGTVTVTGLIALFTEEPGVILKIIGLSWLWAIVPVGLAWLCKWGGQKCDPNLRKINFTLAIFTGLILRGAWFVFTVLL